MSNVYLFLNSPPTARKKVFTLKSSQPLKKVPKIFSGHWRFVTPQIFLNIKNVWLQISKIKWTDLVYRKI